MSASARSWRNLRNLNRAEFAAAILLLLAPVLSFTRESDPFLLRAVVCIAVYCFVMAMVSPQPVRGASLADIRYLIPLIPLCMALEVAVVRILTRTAPAWLGVSLGVVAFGTNLLNGGPFFQEGLRSTTWCFAKELISPSQRFLRFADKNRGRDGPTGISNFAGTLAVPGGGLVGVGSTRNPAVIGGLAVASGKPLPEVRLKTPPTEPDQAVLTITLIPPVLVVPLKMASVAEDKVVPVKPAVYPGLSASPIA
jgi:hypothetical protein